MLLADNFLFIHIDKSAGTSIQKALASYARPQVDSRLRRRMTWLGPVNRLGLYRFMEFPEHSHARTIKACLPVDYYARLYKFAFVRNPWDRLVSRYHFLQRSKERSDYHRIQKLKTFADYLDWEIARGKFYQATHVCDADGQLIVDFIGYYERLNEDFGKVASRLGVNVTLPKANTSKHEDYRSYYTPALRERVAEHYRRDIELFGYEFDGLKK